MSLLDWDPMGPTCPRNHMGHFQGFGERSEQYSVSKFGPRGMSRPSASGGRGIDQVLYRHHDSPCEEQGGLDQGREKPQLQQAVAPPRWGPHLGRVT